MSCVPSPATRCGGARWTARDVLNPLISVPVKRIELKIIENRRMCAIAHIDIFQTLMARVKTFLIEIFIAFRLDNRVTRAGIRLQTAAVKNRDHTSAITNQFIGLQRARRLVHSFTPHAQHIGHEFLGQSKLFLA